MSGSDGRIQAPYNPPHIPHLLSTAAYLYFLSFTSSLCAAIINAPLIGPLVVGVLFGPVVGGLLQESTQRTFIDVGYVGLVLIVFEAGLTTDVSLLVRNIWVSMAAALTGVALPIGLSMALLCGAYDYGVKKAFAAGAALCSTSLGTTLALLTPELKKTRVGCVLIGAALLDDVIGLVIAGIIPNIATSRTSWQTIVRPILVSFAFALFTPVLAFCLHKAVRILLNSLHAAIRRSRTQLFLIITTLFGFVAGSKYAGTSELFGAYLAGALMSRVFSSPDPAIEESRDFDVPASSSYTNQPNENPTLQAYQKHLEPILISFLGPIFFASIGAALPIGALFTVNGSHQVVWRGIVYSLLMVLAKMAVGVCLLIWPEKPPKTSITATSTEDRGKRQDKDVELPAQPKLIINSPPLPTHRQSAALLALAMVARGEIALIVAQLARPLLVAPEDPSTGIPDEEPFAVVIWAILVSTLRGAIAVGLLLRSWRRKHGGPVDE